MLSVMTAPKTTPNKPPKTGVRLSVTISETDWSRLEGLKTKHRVEKGENVSTQDLVSRWITEKLDALKA